jgi:uncharacterized protein
VAPQLAEVLRGFDRVAIAVSGGVDSVTLAEFAHRLLGRTRVMMLHATSAAVPSDAASRLAQFDWDLHVVDARELDNPAYVANPVNRCFFCKTSLYATMRANTDRALLSGTNRDDLGDFRPGLKAAAEHGVRHPFVEADMNKQAVRELARSLGLHDVAELPASPCLSSRIETGIAIAPSMLGFVQAVETLVRGRVGAQRAVRCRVRAAGIVVELDGEVAQAELLRPEVAELMSAHGMSRPLSFAPYSMGSAFLRT